MKVDMSPEAVSERLRIVAELSEELLNSTFEERYRALVIEQEEIKLRSVAEHQDTQDEL
jgi:hypothetical protein